MSGLGEERWRNSRGQQQSNQQQSNPSTARKASSSAQSRGKFSTESPVGPVSVSGNVWPGTERGNDDDRTRPAGEPAPVKGFNAQETREMLKKGFGSVTADEAKAMRYKAPTGQPANKSGGPWGSKASTMGSGKDFFQDLRKQVAALQHSERAGG